METDFDLLDPRLLLSEKTLAFDWTMGDLCRSSRISFPRLQSNPMRTWGDWGATYSIRLRPNQQVLVFTRCEEGTIEQVSHLMPAQLLLESPLEAGEGEEALLLTLDDHWRGYRYQLALNAKGDLCHALVRTD